MDTNVSVFSLEDSQLTIAEAARHLRISRAFLYTLIAGDKIRPVKIGKRTLVQGTEIRRFMQSLESGPGHPAKGRKQGAT